MPNWCSTSYAITGRKQDLDRINDALVNHPVSPNSDPDWQGNILLALGVKSEDITPRYVRGFLRDFTRQGDKLLRIDFDEAWSRTDFAEILQRIFPDIEIYWIAEEPGCEIYQTNDHDALYFAERYFVDTCIDGDYQSEYFSSEAEAYQWLAQISDCHDAADVQAFNDRCPDDSDDYIYVHEYQLC